MKGNYIRFIILLPLCFIWGCSGEQQEQAKPPTPPPTSQTKPAPAAPPAIAVASPPTKTQITSFGLIPPTNAQERLKAVKANRNNPFALMEVPVIVPPSKTAGSLANSGSGNQGKASLVATTQRTAPGQKNSQIVPPEKREGNFCKGSGPDEEIPEFIKIQPEDAQGVLVSGIVNFASTPVAIVLPRGESLERTVSPGSTLSQGRVRVVSINSNTETVTLEQYGKTVTRQVGEAPVEIEPEPPKEEVERPKGPDGFGFVRGLMLDKVSLDKVNLGEATDTGKSQTERRLFGTLCNDSRKPISFNEVKVQIQDAKNNNILDANWNKINQTDATLEPGQKIEFDFIVPKLRGRNAKDIYVKFMNWS